MSWRSRVQRPDTKVYFRKPSRTEQFHKDSCDINNILKRFQATGQLPDLIKSNPQYGEFSDVPSYQEALNIVMDSQTQFAALPSSVRDRFKNDPAQFLSFANDPNNLDEMVTMGLAIPNENAKVVVDDSKVKKQPKPKGGEED